jgi:hypothetical protein
MRTLGLLALATLITACGEDEPLRFRIFTDVEFGDGRFVAVGTDVLGTDTEQPSVIATSSDGDTWELIALPDVPYLTAVAFGNGRWVAVGGGEEYGGPGTTSVIVSDDGVTWRDATAGPDDAFLYNVLFAEDRFVAMTLGIRLFESADGDTWTELANSPSATSLQYVGGMFFSDSGGLSESADLVTWTDVTTADELHGVIAASDGRPVAMTSGPENSDGAPRFDGPWSLLVRDTGGTWSPVETVPDLHLLVVSADQVIASSYEGAGLFRTENVAPEDWSWQHVSDQGAYAAVADGNGTVVTVGYRIQTSHDDGLDWTETLESTY